MIVRTPEEAFEAGWSEPCQHGLPDPTRCPDCRLRPEEIARLAVLLQGLRTPQAASAAA